MTKPLSARFEQLTETTGIPISREGADMLYTRYRVAADLARGCRVLEIGCGSGQGFGLLTRAAARCVGADVSLSLLRSAREHYDVRVPLIRLSAEALPFRAAAFELLLCFEVSYYLSDVSRAVSEISRVLAPGGLVLFVNANPERPDFIPSPHSVHYHSASELRAVLESAGLTVSVQGAFPVDTGTGGLGSRLAGRAVKLARRALQTLRLVPRTLRGRARLKRLVYGNLLTVPPEISDGFGTLAPRVPLGPGPVRAYKVIYVTGRKQLERR